jgi:hypothetical protein
LSGLCFVTKWDHKMAGPKSAEPTPQSIARANRQRLASEEGARAMADVEKQGVAVRKNMERLRALREAKEAEEAQEAKTQAPPTKKKGKRASSN